MPTHFEERALIRTQCRLRALLLGGAAVCALTTGTVAWAGGPVPTSTMPVQGLVNLATPASLRS